MDQKRDCQLNVRIPCELKNALAKKAAEDRRKLSDLVVLILEDAVKAAKTPE